jgi:hypothetical protein
MRTENKPIGPDRATVLEEDKWYTFELTNLVGPDNLPPPGLDKDGKQMKAQTHFSFKLLNNAVDEDGEPIDLGTFLVRASNTFYSRSNSTTPSMFRQILNALVGADEKAEPQYFDDETGEVGYVEQSLFVKLGTRIKARGAFVERPDGTTGYQLAARLHGLTFQAAVQPKSVTGKTAERPAPGLVGRKVSREEGGFPAENSVPRVSDVDPDDIPF